MTHTAGRFTVTMDSAGQTDIEGPAEYLDSTHYTACVAMIARGDSAVVNCAPAGIPLGQLIAVALQTDYAGWRGMQSFLAPAVRS